MSILAIALQKGGLGKTTLCQHIGHTIAARGHRVLMIDLDPQGSLTSITGATVAAGSMAAVVGHSEPGTGDIAAIVQSVGPGLDIAPAGVDLAVSESALILRRARETILQNAIEGVIARYDYVLIDCPPGLGLLMTNAVIAADWVIMPALLDSMTLAAIELFTDTLAGIRADFPQAAGLLGTVANRADLRTVLQREIWAALQGRVDLRTFETTIPQTIKFAEAATLQTTVNEYEPGSAAAVAIEQLTTEVIERMTPDGQ